MGTTYAVAKLTQESFVSTLGGEESAVKEAPAVQFIYDLAASAKKSDGQALLWLQHQLVVHAGFVPAHPDKIWLTKVEGLRLWEKRGEIN